jgi:hypothetical protein
MPKTRPARVPSATVARTSTVTSRPMLPAWGADGQPNADFPPPLQHGVIEDAVQPHARQQQCDQREEQRESGQQPLAYGVRLIQFLLRLEIDHVEIGARSRYLAS